MSDSSAAIRRWVDEVRSLCTPDRVAYCDGSEQEKERLIHECLATGELIELNQHKLPGCYLHRSAPHEHDQLAKRIHDGVPTADLHGRDAGH